MSFKKGFLRNLLISGGYNYATQATLFFSTVITSRLLAPETFGFVSLIAVFTGFVSIFADSGISYAVIRSDYKTSYHKALDNLALYLGLLLCLVTWIFAYPISLFFQQPALSLPTIIMGLLFVIKSLTPVRGALLSKALRFAEVGKVTLLASGLQVVLTVMLALLGASYWSLILPQLVSALLVLVLYERKMQLGFAFRSRAQVKVAYRFTRKTIGSLMGFNLIYYWARNLDNLIVGKSFGVTDLGIYNRAYNLLMMPMGIITGLIGTVLFPSFKKLKSEGGDVSREYLFILKMICVITYPVSMALILFPTELVLLLWGRGWLAVAQFLPYFGLLLFSQSLLSTTGSMLVLFEKRKTMVLSGWLGTMATTGGILYGASVSIIGIAQFYSLAFVVVVLPFNLFYLFIYTFRFNRWNMLLFWLPIIGLSLCIWLSCYYNNSQARWLGVGLLFLFILLQNRREMAMLSGKLLARRSLQLVRFTPNKSV